MARSRYALSAAAAILVVISVFASTASAKPDPGGVLVEGLNNPRGIAAGGAGSVLVAESGNGKLTLVEPRRRGAPMVRTFATLPVDPETGNGPTDVAFKSLNKVWAVLSGPPEETGGDFGRLVRLNRKGKVVESFDIAAYQVGDPDPDDQEDLPAESNPNGLALLPGGGVLVADAAGNDLLKVDTRRRITTVARFKPELVPWPAGLPFPGPVEPGEPFPVESVPTAVAIGPDGAWYVSELKGFPFPQGKSRIWRIEPGAVGATCDPGQPERRPLPHGGDGLHVGHRPGLRPRRDDVRPRDREERPPRRRGLRRAADRRSVGREGRDEDRARHRDAHGSRRRRRQLRRHAQRHDRHRVRPRGRRGRPRPSVDSRRGGPAHTGPPLG